MFLVKKLHDETELKMKTGIKVDLNEHFSVVRESLDRIGIAHKGKKTIIPLCYILHRTNYETTQSEYYIIHYKKLFKMDGAKIYITKEDEIKEASIARLLEKWGLVKIENKTELPVKNSFVYVLPFKEKDKWEITHKYKIGTSE